MPTKLKNEELQIVDYRYDEGIRGRVDSDISSTLTTKNSGFSGMPMIMKKVNGGGLLPMLRIRKLTPKECIRLMGFSDDDYNALRNAGLSDSAIYHVAGDSIITTCLVALLNSFVNEEHKHIDIINNYVEKEIVNDTIY